MKRETVLSIGFSMIVSLGLFTFGCSSDGGSSTPTKLDAGKKDGGGTDGKGGSGGSNGTGGANGTGGSIASGGANGSGGSSAKGGSNGSGGSVGSGGSSAKGGSVGSGGSSAGGTGGSSSGSGSGGQTAAGGSTGNGGTTSGTGGGTGGGQANDGGPIDSGTSDALDAPAPGDDGSTSIDQAPGVDSGLAIVLDSGSLDSQGVDGPVAFFDTGVDSAADAPVDSPADAAADSPAVDAGVDGTVTANCIQRIINAGYASGSIDPCSSCHDNSTQLESDCQNMIKCLVNTGPDSGPCTVAGSSCEVTCRNNFVLVGGIVAETCVLNLVNDACK